MPTVLIIDDQFTSRQILAELVHSIGGDVQVEAFEKPTDALHWLNWHSADLILTDYKMPDMDGIEFIRRCRSLESCQNVPLVMVTSIEDREVRYTALEVGATDFLTKPVDHYECRARCANLLCLHQQHMIIQDRAHWLEKRVNDAIGAIRVREQETLLRLAKAGEYRDEETGNHVIRMAKFARLIGERMGLSRDECDVIELAAPMHDIGKIGIPDQILLKPGRLTTEEFAVMKRHTDIGHDILKNSPSEYLQLGAVIAYAHHEKFDGTGYPQGLRAEDIPLAARIVAVADVFDALCSERPYKRPWSRHEALRYLQEQSGRHFDPMCFEAFHAQLDKILRVQDLLRDEPVRKTAHPAME